MSKNLIVSEDITKALTGAGRVYNKAAAVKSLKWQTEKQHAITIVKNNQSLQAADPSSLEQAFLQAASMGLTLNPQRQYCYIIPRKARKKAQNESWDDYKRTVPTIAYASPSYRGLTHLATIGGLVTFMCAEIVYKGDRYIDHGPAEKPDHTPNVRAPRGWGDAIGVYALAKLSSGDYRREYIDRDTVERIRNLSDNKDGLMWNPQKLWTEGWKKTAIRRLFKTLPEASDAMAAASDSMDRFEGIVIDETAQQGSSSGVCIDEAQTNELYAIITDAGIEGDSVQKWAGKIAQRFGVGDVSGITIEDFDAAKEILREGVKAWKDKQK